jgi:hypothetical protein
MLVSARPRGRLREARRRSARAWTSWRPAKSRWAGYGSPAVGGRRPWSLIRGCGPRHWRITASEPSWITLFTGLSPRSFGKLMTVVRREIPGAARRGRPWSLPLEDRVLLVAAYWRTNLTLRQLAALFGVSKSAADRIIDHLGLKLALQPRKRFGKDTCRRTHERPHPRTDERPQFLTC